MGKLSGTVLILAGVSMAAYTLSAQQGPGTKAAMTADNATPAKTAPVPAKTPAATAPSAPAAAPTASSAGPGASGPPRPKSAAASPATSTLPATSVSPPAAPQKLRAGVLAPVKVAEAPPRLPVGETAATAGPPLDGPALTREIQRQLKRIGCYQGEVSGVWSASVRHAVKAVADHVNASLPIDQPDSVLLAMVESQEPGTCSSCPNGQDRAADGRCLPAALVAKAGKQPTPPAPAQAGRAKAGASTTAPTGARSAVASDTAAPAPHYDERMSLAGPKAEVPRQARARPRRARSGARRAHAYRPPSPRVRQRSAQRSGPPFWTIPFLLP
jgi:hypothetical protein